MAHMVRRAYLIDRNPFTAQTLRRVLVDEHYVFIPSSGWHGRNFIEENYRLVFLPGEIEHHDWWGDWENGKNARLTDWGWCHGVFWPSEFRACRRLKHEDGTETIQVA